MTDVPVESEAASASVTLLPSGDRRKIFLYLGALVTLVAFGDPNGGLIDIAVSFLLKNKLHLQARDLAHFRLIAAVPLYCAGLFGFLRDRWNPLQIKDRGFFILFGALGAGLYVIFAFLPVTEATLLIAIVTLTIAFLFVSSAVNGLASTLGRQHAMTGRVAALWQSFESLPLVAALLVGGHLSDWLERQETAFAAQALFLVGALCLAAVSIYGWLRPRAVFDKLAPEPLSAHPLDDLRRLLRHKPIYPALAIWLFWNFAPGSQTPLQFYLQNELHAPDSVYAEFNAIFAASFIPPFLLYSVLCRRIALNKLLVWGTVIAIPQMIPLLFLHSPEGALIAAAPIGVMGGVATASYLDLLMRSCPTGLEGATLMLSGALYSVSARFGDVLGAALYDSFGGFTVCVAMITLVYALILPLIRLVPRELTCYADGQAGAPRTEG